MGEQAMEEGRPGVELDSEGFEDEGEASEYRGVRALEPGENPREALPFHRERGPRRFAYTYQEIADAAGLAVSTVQKYAQQGRFDPTTLESVVAFLRDREPDPGHDVLAELEALQTKIGCGLSVVGTRSDGRGVFGFDTPNSPDFRETRLRVAAALIKAGYVCAPWSSGEGKTLAGWGRRTD